MSHVTPLPLMDPESSPELGALIDSFLGRFRNGERPRIEDYQDRCPLLADRIGELFPTLIQIESLAASARGHSQGDQSLSAGGNTPSQSDSSAPSFTLSSSPISLPCQLGDYHLFRYVGEGGMGVVYEAERQSLRSRVALKVMHARFRSNPQYLRLFHTEARSAAALHHTNIVSVFDYGEEGDVCYYAMQFIDGVGLDRVIDEARLERGLDTPADRARRHHRAQTVVEGAPSPSTSEDQGDDFALDPAVGYDSAMLPLTQQIQTAEVSTPEPVPDGSAVGSPLVEANEAVAPFILDPERSDTSTSRPLSAAQRKAYFLNIARIGFQVAEALEYAHQRGVLHRDIKPSNILLDGVGNAWITDFGLAKYENAGDLSHSQELVGTLRYLAPERFDGKSDRRGDLYALGATLYEMLTLQPAFQGKNPLEMIDQIAKVPPRPLRKIDPAIPIDLETIVLKAMAKEPQDRFANAQEMADELRRFLDGRPIVSRRINPIERYWRWCKRNRLLASMNAIAAVLTTFIAIGSTIGMLVISNERNNYREKSLELGKTTRSLELARSRADDEARRANAERDRAEQFVYESDMNLAAIGSVREGRDLLDRHAPPAHTGRDRRDLVWRLLWSRGHDPAQTLRTGLNPIATAIDSEGVLSVCDEAGQLDRWRVGDGQYLESMRTGSSECPGTQCISPRGDRMVRAEVLGTRLRLLAVRNGKVCHVIEGQSPVLDAVFSPDGAYLLSLWGDRTARVHEVSTGRIRHEILLSHQGMGPAAISPDGSRVYLGNHRANGDLVEYTLDDGKSRVLQQGRSTVAAIALSPDGDRLALGTLLGELMIWHRQEETMTGLGADDGPLLVRITALCFDGRGTRLAAGCPDGMVAVWELDTGRSISLRAHVGSVESLAFDPVTDLLVTGDSEGIFQCWDLENLDGSIRIDQGQPIDSLATSEQGDLVAVARNTIQLRSAEDGRRLRTFTPVPATVPVTAMSFSRDGRVLASGDADSRIMIWDVEASSQAPERIMGGMPASFYGEERLLHEGAPRSKCAVSTLDFSPDGSRIAVGFGAIFLYVPNYQQVVQIWDVASGDLVKTIGPFENTIVRVAYSGDGTQLTVVCRGGSISRWSTRTWERLALFNEDSPISSADLSLAHQRIALGFFDGQVRCRDLTTGEVLGTGLAHGGITQRVLFFPGDDYLLTIGRSDRTLKLWSLDPGHHLRPMSVVEPQDCSIAALTLDTHQINSFMGLACNGQRLILSGESDTSLIPIDSLEAIDEQRRIAREAAARGSQDHLANDRGATHGEAGATALTSAQEQAFTGRFKLECGLEIRIEHRGDSLVLVTPLDRNVLPIHASSPDHCTVIANGGQIRFEGPGERGWERVRITVDGDTLTANRVATAEMPWLGTAAAASLRPAD